jgi:hypothetical protein
MIKMIFKMSLLLTFSMQSASHVPIFIGLFTRDVCTDKKEIYRGVCLVNKELLCNFVLSCEKPTGPISFKYLPNSQFVYNYKPEEEWTSLNDSLTVRDVLRGAREAFQKEKERIALMNANDAMLFNPGY